MVKRVYEYIGLFLFVSMCVIIGQPELICGAKAFSEELVYKTLSPIEFRLSLGEIEVNRSRKVGRAYSSNGMILGISDHIHKTDGSDSPLLEKVPEHIEAGFVVAKTPPEDVIVVVQTIPTKALPGKGRSHAAQYIVVAGIMLLTVVAGFVILVLFGKKIRDIKSGKIVIALILAGLGSIPGLYFGDKFLIHDFFIDNATNFDYLVTIDSEIIPVQSGSHVRTGLTSGSHTIVVKTPTGDLAGEAYEFSLRSRVGGGAQTYVYNLLNANSYSVTVERYVSKD